MTTIFEEMKYPFEITSVVRNQTFAVAVNFSVRKKEDDRPLEILSDVSRFVLTIINKERNAVNAKVTVSDFKEMTRKSQYFYQKYLDHMYFPFGEETKSEDDITNSTAFTTKFRCGTYKGSTPVEVLLKHQDEGVEILRKQYGWIKQNGNDKYAEANKALMQAIIEAVDLYKEGKLQNITSASTTAKCFTIFASGFRPILSKKDENGNSLVREYQITYLPENRYPINVELVEYYAPVTQEKGLLNVQKTKMVKGSEKKNNMYLSFDEWMNVLETMQESLTQFKQVHMSSAWKSIQMNN